jgi:hypothetical protein
LRHVFLVKLAAFDKRNGCAIHWLKCPKNSGLVPHELENSNPTIGEPISNNWALSLRELSGHGNSLTCPLKNVIVHKCVSFIIQNSQLLVLARHDWVENHLTSHWSHYKVVDLVIANVIVLIQDFARRATLVTIQNVFTGAP